MILGTRSLKAIPPGVQGFKEIFESRTRTEGDCVLWTGYTNHDGYGRLSIKGNLYMAHRIAWSLRNGPAPRDKLVLHKCDNPPCVNPDHLFLGDDLDNAQDKSQKGRAYRRSLATTHCKNGHEFREENTYITPEGHRSCRICRAAHARRYYRQSKSF